MKKIHFLVCRGLLLIAFLTTYLYFLSAQEREHSVAIVRNVAWNDFLHQIDLVHQIDPSVGSSARQPLRTEIVLIQKSLREHQFETSVNVYDIAVFKAIDQARVRLQQADKDLETIRNELSYKEYQANERR